MSVWSAPVTYAIGIRSTNTDDGLLKISVTNRFDEDIDETVALQDVLERETHNLDDNWKKDRQYFAWYFGEGNALKVKNDLKALFRTAGLQRSDVYNRQGDHTADYFDMNGENDTFVLEIIGKYLAKNDIYLGDTFIACPICSKYIYGDKTTYSCANAQIEYDDDDNPSERTCLTIIHERCMKKYLKKHPRCSHDIDSDDWVCADCIDG
jgi:hypothetical protein